MAEKKHFGDCPECGAPCEVIETSYIEEGHEVHFVEHKYSTRGAVWVKASDRLPGWKARVKWRDGNDHYNATKGEISFFEMDKPNLEGWEWYDESPAEQPVLPTFWDVAKAFKWAAEYKTDKGEHLMLADGWCLMSDGGVNEELTPGGVAELYCLQKGFDKAEQPVAVNAVTIVLNPDGGIDNVYQDKGAALKFCAENGGYTPITHSVIAGTAEQPGREVMTKDQFDNWHLWLSNGGYTFDGEYYYDEENNFLTTAQLWEVFKKEKV